MAELSEKGFIITLVIGTLILLSLIVLLSVYLVRLIKQVNKKNKNAPSEPYVIKEGVDYKVEKNQQSSDRYEIFDYKLKSAFDGKDDQMSQEIEVVSTKNEVDYRQISGEIPGQVVDF